MKWFPISLITRRIPSKRIMRYKYKPTRTPVIKKTDGIGLLEGLQQSTTTQGTGQLKEKRWPAHSGEAFEMLPQGWLLCGAVGSFCFKPLHLAFRSPPSSAHEFSLQVSCLCPNHPFIRTSVVLGQGSL